MFMAMLLGLLPPGGYAQERGSTTTQEYFVQQGAGEGLLVRIDGYEAEFESQIREEDGRTVLVSGIAQSRVAPLFQYVAEPGMARQLGIEIHSKATTARSRFELGVTRLTVWDERSNAVSHAYRLLSFGMQTPEAVSDAAWTVRIGSLNEAASLFRQYGMNEMRLWSRYLAAHLVQYHLQDYSIAHRLALELLADLSVTHIPDIELATRELQTDALIGLKRKGALPGSMDQADPVQSALARTGTFANSIGASYAQARALALSGTEYALEGLVSEALEQYRLALALAEAVGDAGLSKHIRERVVEIHTRQGNAPAQGEVLQQIESQLAQQGDGDELALNLLAQGRLLIAQYRYDAARKVLNEALSYQDHSAIRKQLEVELARVFFASGRFDEALAMLQSAGVHAGDHRQRRPSSIIDNNLALGLLADIQRNRSAFANMREAREAQGLYTTDRARYRLHQGLDALAEGNRERAHTRLLESTRAAQASGDRDVSDLALLRLCSLGQGCPAADAADAYQRLLGRGIPALAVEAMYLRAGIQANAGQRLEASQTLEALVGEIHFLRHELPGVLGAWYHENHAPLSDFYLRLQRLGTGNADAAASLLALTRLRLIEAYDSAPPEALDAAADRHDLRTQLSEHTSGDTGSAEIALALEALRKPFREQFAHLSPGGVRRYLDGLGRDEVLITWHVSDTIAQVWIGRHGRVVTRSIGQAADIAKRLAQANASLNNAAHSDFTRAMDALGQDLLAPVSDVLERKIYWVPAGLLLGLPLDALRLNGRHLVERHSVSAVLSFPANPGSAHKQRQGEGGSVFLAGNPQDYSSDYATRFDTSDEIRALMELFVGPGLHVVQGPALLPDEFQDPRFAGAGIIHLSMPGVIDLRNPVESSLELSGSEFGPRRTRYRLEGIAPGSLQARLVLLSSSRAAGRPVSAFNANPGIISGFARAGAAAVVADFWDTQGVADREFLVDFYRELQRTGDPATALQAAKRHYLKHNRDSGLFGWAGYQLFTP